MTQAGTSRERIAPTRPAPRRSPSPARAVRSAPCSPPEDVMTTTAVRTLRMNPHRGGDVLNERFRVAPLRGDAQPRAEDACRVGIMRRIAAARLRYRGLEA